MTEENVETLLADCAGKTKRATEEYLVARRPRPVFGPSIRRLPARPIEVSSNEKRSAPEEALASARGEHEASGRPVEAATAPTLPSPPPPQFVQPATPGRFNFRFAAGREFKEKLERLAEIAGVENPQAHLAELLETALDLALDKKDPKRKLERRREREAKRTSSGGTTRELAAPKSRPDEIPIDCGRAKSRHIPSEISERVHARAGYQCEYRGPDGRRCTARTGLQIEHDPPFAVHRSHDERLLKLFCARHNRLSAERFFGAAFIQSKIAQRADRAHLTSNSRNPARSGPSS